tara:strand:+ start:4 stop:120 length:117 start_codon:yes stop_codon:yes gene_type:complete
MLLARTIPNKKQKKLDITPRPVLQYKNEVEREKKFKCE